MENGNYYISVEKSSGHTFYLQYLDGKFQLGAEGENGGAAGQFEVVLNGDQISLHVHVNDNLVGYVNSYDDGGGDKMLHLGDPIEYFNFTEDSNGDVSIFTEITEDDQTYEGYFTTDNEDTAPAVFLNPQEVDPSGDRPVQKWKFTVVTIDDIVIDPALTQD